MPYLQIAPLEYYFHPEHIQQTHELSEVQYWLLMVDELQLPVCM
jgi:hypothetical protein